MLLLRVTSMSKGINFTPFLPAESTTTRRPSSYTRHGCIRLAPIVQYSPLLPPVGVWTVSQFQCGWSSSPDQLGDRRLGEPLPHQQANPIWAHPMARGPKVPSLVLRRYAVLATVSSSYPPPSGSFPDITHPSATRQRNSKLFPVTVRLACVRPAASVQSEP